MTQKITIRGGPQYASCSDIKGNSGAMSMVLTGEAYFRLTKDWPTQQHVVQYQEIITDIGSIQFRLRTLCSRVEIEYVYIFQVVLFVPYT